MWLVLGFDIDWLRMTDGINIVMSHSDTSPEAAAILRERMLRMTPSERIEEGARLCKFARQMMRAGIRHRHPDYDEPHVEMALVRLLWGDDLYRKARPDWPLLET
jgi:hypothetical protein